MKSEDLYRKAIETWGVQLQLIMVFEECSELIKEICKWERMKDNSNVDNILEEIADVEIMLEQLKYMFDYYQSDKNQLSMFELMKAHKLKRLEKMLE